MPVLSLSSNLMADPLLIFPHIPQDNYPINLITAHDAISQIYQHALQISACEDADPLQLSFHCDTITSDALPLLEAIGEDSGVTKDWLVAATTALALVATRLQDYHACIGDR